MPVYSYECRKCGQRCDTLKDRCSSSIDAEVCPCCGEQMTRIMTGIRATFKGSGFYSTDYRK